MLKSFRAKRWGVFFWAIIVLLIIGLAGFGIGVGGLGTQNVARVGDRDISREDFLRAFDNELRAISQQAGRTLTADEARRFGIDRLVLARLVSEAALDEEAERLGLSTGDVFVAEQIQGIPAFQGLDGSFDPEAYRFALQRVGLSVREFEEQVRRESTRELIAASLQSPAAMPDSAARTVLDFLGEERAFSYLRLGPDQLAEPIPEPTEEELRAFHEENAEAYTRPETREITYALLTPEALAETVEITDETVAETYAADPDRFDTPEQRFADRITFGTAEEAVGARARLDAGEVTFDALAAERELSARDIDQGLLAPGDLPPEAREAVFGAEGPGILGPVETPLGPSLYRLNGIVAGEEVPEDEARARVREELARAEAEAAIFDVARELEDLVAAGATIEEIAAETPLEAGETALNEETTDGIAANPAFREAALAAEPGFETDPVELAGGGIAALRVDEVVPPTLLPLDEVRDAVAADWRAAQTRERLADVAETLRAEIAEGTALAEIAERLGVSVESAGPLTRGETAEGAPAELVAEIFAVEPERTVLLPEGDGVILARLDEVLPFDPETEENAAALDAVEAQLRRGLADDMLTLASRALQGQAGITVNESVLDSTLSAVQ